MHKKENNNNKSQNFIQGLRIFSSTVPKGLKKILKKNGYNFSNIVDNWTKIIGKDLASNCYPNNVKIGKNMSNGILILNVIHGNELNIEYAKNEIIDKINSFFGYKYIGEIKLKIVQEKINHVNKNNFSNANRGIFNNKLDKLQNNNLKNSLNKLIKAYDEKNN